MVDIDIEKQLEKELTAIEKLLWTGRPPKGILFDRNDLFYVPLHLIFLGGVISIFLFTFKTDKGGFFYWYSLMFLIIGFYFLIGRFFYDSWRRANTQYGITEIRVIIKSGAIFKHFKSIYIKDINELSTNEKPDGSGTIIFGHDVIIYPLIDKYSNKVVPPKLERISEMKKTYELLLKLKNG